MSKYNSCFVVFCYASYFVGPSPGHFVEDILYNIVYLRSFSASNKNIVELFDIFKIYKDTILIRLRKLIPNS